MASPNRVASARRRHTDLSSYSFDPSIKTTLKGPFYGFTLKTSTWISDSHGLYDYESHYVSAKTYRCYGRSNAYRLIRKGVDVQLLADDVAVRKLCEDSELSSVAVITALEDGGYRIDSMSANSDSELRRQFAPASPSSSSGVSANSSEDLRFWLVARSIRTGSIPLATGDTLKLGRCAYKVKRLVLATTHPQNKNNKDNEEDASCETDRTGDKDFPSQHAEEEEEDQQEDNDSVTLATGTGLLPEENISISSQKVEMVATEQDSFTKCCRICLCDEESPLEDPLLTPCVCKGSMQWVHLKCLRTWMEGRLNVTGDSEKKICFFWQPLECELCRAPYPTYVSIRGNTPQDAPPGFDACQYKLEQDPIDRVVEAAINMQQMEPTEREDVVELFSIPKPTVPFIVLECTQANGASGYYFLNFGADNVLKMGRGHEADIRVADISVSRLHASIRYEPTPNALATVLRESLPSSSGGGGGGVGGDKGGGEGGETLLRNPLGHIVLPVRANEPYVYLEDMKSKFGTLIAIDKPVYLYPKMMLSLQVGRTVITMHVRKPTWSRLIPSCFNVNYKSLIPRLRRKPSATATNNNNMDFDHRDVRLLDTYLPFSVLPTNSLQTDRAQPGAAEEGEIAESQTHREPLTDPMAATRLI